MFCPPLALLFNGLWFARNWQIFANQQLYPILAAMLTAGRTHGFTDSYALPKTPVGPPPATPSDNPRSYPVEAIAGADGVSSNGIPMKKVFDNLVEATGNYAPTCMSSILVAFEDLWVDETPQSVPCGPVCKRYTFLSLPCIPADMGG